MLPVTLVSPVLLVGRCSTVFPWHQDCALIENCLVKNNEPEGKEVIRYICFDNEGIPVNSYFYFDAYEMVPKQRGKTMEIHVDMVNCL